MDVSEVSHVAPNLDYSSSIKTQFLLFTLLGDYVIPRGGSIWTAHLLQLLDLLDVNEQTARTTLSRMSRRGWLAAHKEGRHSRYTLTSRGLALIEEGRKRIFEPLLTDWDGCWFLVIYSLPESRRKLRDDLRKQLAWLGFGRLAPASWISPHDRRVELNSLFRELEVQDYVEIFSGIHLGPASKQSLIQRCWDLPGLAAEYGKFVTHYQHEYDLVLDESDEARCASPKSCFVRRFWITHHFQPFPLRDPNLPTELLPANWIGFKARQLFHDYRRLLKPWAEQFVDSVLAGD